MEEDNKLSLSITSKPHDDESVDINVNIPKVEEKEPAPKKEEKENEKSVSVGVGTETDTSDVFVQVGPKMEDDSTQVRPDDMPGMVNEKVGGDKSYAETKDIGVDTSDLVPPPTAQPITDEEIAADIPEIWGEDNHSFDPDDVRFEMPDIPVIEPEIHEIPDPISDIDEIPDAGYEEVPEDHSTDDLIIPEKKSKEKVDIDEPEPDVDNTLNMYDDTGYETDDEPEPTPKVPEITNIAIKEEPHKRTYRSEIHVGEQEQVYIRIRSQVDAEGTAYGPWSRTLTFTTKEAPIEKTKEETPEAPVSPDVSEEYIPEITDYTNTPLKEEKPPIEVTVDYPTYLDPLPEEFFEFKFNLPLDISEAKVQIVREML